MLNYQGSNPFANLFGQAGGLGQKGRVSQLKTQVNPFASAGSGEDGLASFLSQVQQGVISPNLNNPPLPAEGQGGRLFAMG